MKKVDPQVSEYMRQLNAKRKKRVGGFSVPEVQEKIAKIRQENAKKAQENSSPKTT
jgi:hypothetical protein